MKTLHAAISIAAMLLLVYGTTAAQNAAPKYDTTAEMRIQGKVLSVHERECPVSGTLGLHFMLEAVDGKVYEVHVAPTKFAKSFDVTFTAGEKVEVLGTTLTFQGKNAILAREVKHGNETETFRDKKGNPSWN